ncbi:MAG: hypothetical protein R3304_08770 [Longimicrobiales bacterium]|nr:hypothetical protein [Longimicrobiales bacterium]
MVQPHGVGGQSGPDPRSVLQEVREAQEEFERFRESRTPIHRSGRPDGACDEWIGRICIWFGGEDEASFPAELREVREARVDLVRRLSDAFEAVRHPWILGQWVHYLVELGEVDEARRVAESCGLSEQWWCDALLGYALHMRSMYVESEAAFRNALASMPDALREEWTGLRHVLTEDGLEIVTESSPEDRSRLLELFWRLSDPLLIYEGNDRLTDHFVRWVLVELRRDAAAPLGLEWDTDLEATLVRYGRNIGYSRTHDPGRMLSGGSLDTRRMVGHHHPKSRGYLFPERFLESPADIPAESWITAPRDARTWYAPLYAPEIQGLETQVGRFRRDGAMLVIGAYRPTVPEEDGRSTPAWPGGSDGPEPPHASLFLVPENGEPPFNVLGREPEGVLRLEAPPGRYVSSLEVVDVANRRAWRARQGVVQDTLTPGLVGVSDLMLLREGAPLPASLEEALPHVRPGIRLREGERFGVVWEVYGLRIQEPVQVTIGFSRGRPGFLERVGEFLGVIQPEEDVDITFEDVGPDRVQAVFRSVELELPDLDPGQYTLHLRLELPGRTPVVTSRPLVVEG